VLTDEQIEQGKKTTRYSSREAPHHEHPDCIRIAYEWLDAQTKTASANKRTTFSIKHIIERWAGRYVSASDVDVAAAMHPAISGTYPYFNISSRLIEPHPRRLSKIAEAGTQPSYCEREVSDVYGPRRER
jgi:hypothetical protein